MPSIALCIQGGGSRGTYAAGPLGVLMENSIWADYVIGTSCGSLMGTNYVAKQTHRAEEQTLFMCTDKRFFKPFGIFSPRETMYDYDYLVNEIGHTTIPLDFDTFYKNPCKFEAVVTNCLTGQTEYLEKSLPHFLPDALAASGALPLTTKPVDFDGVPYLDGGVSCPIGFERALALGYDKVIVIATRAKGYRKGEVKPAQFRLVRHMYRDYPQFLELYRRTNALYNAQMDRLDALAESGKIFVIYPSVASRVSHSEKNQKILQKLMDMGKKDTIRALPSLKTFLSK
jgi:predicted patatin/cPLA2 family phospholipase